MNCCDLNPQYIDWELRKAICTACFNNKYVQKRLKTLWDYQ